jgi:hypothetical protein
MRKIKIFLLLFLSTFLYLVIPASEAQAFVSSVNACAANPVCASQLGLTAAAAGVGTSIAVQNGNEFLQHNLTQEQATEMQSLASGGQQGQIQGQEYEKVLLDVQVQQPDCDGQGGYSGQTDTFEAWASISNGPYVGPLSVRVTGGNVWLDESNGDSNLEFSTSISLFCLGETKTKSISASIKEAYKEDGTLDEGTISLPTPEQFGEVLGTNPTTIKKTLPPGEYEPKYPPIKMPNGGAVVTDAPQVVEVPPGHQYNPETGEVEPIPDETTQPTVDPQDLNSDGEVTPEEKTADNTQGEGPGPEAVDPIPPAEFSKPHFLIYAAQVFSDKFPLDMLGDLPSPGEPSACPVFTFFGEDFEVCFVNQAMDMMKIPVVVAVAIWGLIAL